MSKVNSIESLNAGDKVFVTQDGKRYVMVVSRVYNDQSLGSANSRTATVSLGPGRWSFDLHNDTLAKHNVEHAPADRETGKVGDDVESLPWTHKRIGNR